MSNLLSRFVKRIKFWLFEERDDVFADNPKRRRQLHNAYVIQACIALIGIGTVALIPLVLWLTVKGFVLVYLILTAVAGILYVTISSYVKRLNKRYVLD